MSKPLGIERQTKNTEGRNAWVSNWQMSRRGKGDNRIAVWTMQNREDTEYLHNE